MICKDICPRTLVTVSFSEQFSESEVRLRKSVCFEEKIHG